MTTKERSVCRSEPSSSSAPPTLLSPSSISIERRLAVIYLFSVLRTGMPTRPSRRPARSVRRSGLNSFAIFKLFSAFREKTQIYNLFYSRCAPFFVSSLLFCSCLLSACNPLSFSGFYCTSFSSHPATIETTQFKKTKTHARYYDYDSGECKL